MCTCRRVSGVNNYRLPRIKFNFVKYEDMRTSIFKNSYIFILYSKLITDLNRGYKNIKSGY